MKKEQIIQTCLEVSTGENYLEIGVGSGYGLVPIKAKRKWGVDPTILSPWESFKDCLKKNTFSFREGIRFLRQRTGFLRDRVRLFEMTSDRFFETKSEFLDRYKIDVALVDGLHTYEQSLTDVINCLTYLRTGGFIVIHDCNPTTGAMAYPTNSREDAAKKKLPGWTGEWCGDVWKAIVHLRAHRDDLFVCVLDCDYGVGLVKRGKPESMLDLPLEHIRDMPYQDLVSRREELLNLKHPDFLNDFIGHS